MCFPWQLKGNYVLVSEEFNLVQWKDKGYLPWLCKKEELFWLFLAQSVAFLLVFSISIVSFSGGLHFVLVQFLLLSLNTWKLGNLKSKRVHLSSQFWKCKVRGLHRTTGRTLSGPHRHHTARDKGACMHVSVTSVFPLSSYKGFIHVCPNLPWSSHRQSTSTCDNPVKFPPSSYLTMRTNFQHMNSKQTNGCPIQAAAWLPVLSASFTSTGSFHCNVPYALPSFVPSKQPGYHPPHHAILLGLSMICFLSPAHAFTNMGEGRRGDAAFSVLGGSPRVRPEPGGSPFTWSLCMHKQIFSSIHVAVVPQKTLQCCKEQTTFWCFWYEANLGVTEFPVNR